jgi:hypothetical protein
MRYTIASAIASLLVLGAADAARANDDYAPAPGRPAVTVSNMVDFASGEALVGASTLTRYNSFVETAVSTTGLAENAAYSLWWVVFNYPEYCVGGCGDDDLPVGATPTSNGDPRIRVSLLWGGGFVSDAGGAGDVRAHLDRAHAPGEVRFGPGLRRPRHAEIHVVVRTHGPAEAGEVAAQIGSFDGGCTEEEIAAGECPNVNVQASVHGVKQ